MEATRTRKKYSSIISGWRVSLSFGIACVAGEPHGGLCFWTCFREFVLYGGMGRKYGIGCLGVCFV
jgi:hypothetical protein